MTLELNSSYVLMRRKTPSQPMPTTTNIPKKFRRGVLVMLRQDVYVQYASGSESNMHKKAATVSSPLLDVCATTDTTKTNPMAAKRESYARACRTE